MIHRGYFCQYHIPLFIRKRGRGCRGHDSMIDEFITTYVISAYHN